MLHVLFIPFGRPLILPSFRPSFLYMLPDLSLLSFAKWHEYLRKQIIMLIGSRANEQLQTIFFHKFLVICSSTPYGASSH